MIEGAANSGDRGMTQVYQMFRSQVCRLLVVEAYLIDIVLLREGAIDDDERDTLLFQRQQMSAFSVRVFRHEGHENKTIDLLSLQCLNRLNFALHIRSTRQENIIALWAQYILNAFDNGQEEVAHDRCKHNAYRGRLTLDHAASNGVGAVLQRLHGAEHACPFGLADVLSIAIQDLRDGAHRDLGQLSNISNSDGFPTHHLTPWRWTKTFLKVYPLNVQKSIQFITEIRS